MASYLINKIAKTLDAKLILRKPFYISQIFTDSRSVINPENSLFIAIKGVHHNGHNFIEELYKKDIRNFLISENEIISNKLNDANFIVVKNTVDALQKLVASHRRKFNIPIIGITGSNGKTIIKDWLSQILGEDKVITKSPKSYNSQIGVPLSVWQLNENSQIGIFEAGISQPGEMQNLQRIIQPKIGIITNIGNAHQENFENIREKIREKLLLFQSCNTLIYCKDHKNIQQEIYNSALLERTKFFTWALKQNADLEISEIKKEEQKTIISGNYRENKITISIPFTDNASIENAIHVWAMLLNLNYDNEIIAKRMKQLAPVAMRLELKQGINNCTIINDSYNSDIESLTIALDYLNQQNQHPVKTLIISDILQSGLQPEILYNEVSKLIKHKNVSKLIGIGENITKQKSKFDIPSDFFDSTDEFISHLRKTSFSDESILIKGARKFEFEKISDLLQEKAHRTVLEINLDALTHNLNYFRNKLSENTKIMIMVKAFSYGSGSFEIANLLEHHRVDYLGVAFADEGITLRKAGISLPILVLNPEQQAMASMVDYNLEPEIYSFSSLKSFILVLKSKNIKSYPVHIKIDTGMHRLGFLPNEINKLIETLLNSDLLVKSVFSHLTSADEDYEDEFTKHQFKVFEKVKSEFENSFKEGILFHILNSAGIERFPDNQYNMVRLGIGLYGISVGEKGLKNVSTLKTQILQIKTLSKDESIGYNRKGKLTRESKIAIIPIGYADGLSRLLSNGNGYVIVNGHKAPFIGNICMDMCMIDLTNIKAKEGNTVIVFGEENPVSQLAKRLHTIPYEIFTNISQRVKRIYFHEN